VRTAAATVHRAPRRAADLSLDEAVIALVSSGFAKLNQRNALTMLDQRNALIVPQD
jgi:hypothetical protein